MTTLFSNLGYNYSDPHGDVTDFSLDTIDHLKALPSIIEDWQIEDIATSNVSGYLQNPLGTISTTIAVTSNLIMNLQSTIEIYDNIGVSNIMANVANAANNLISTMNAFKDHTDRVSGVVDYSDAVQANPADTTVISTKPFKNTIKGFSKLLMYVIYQTVGITNTSIMYGSQTSLFTGPEANTYSNTLTTYKTTVNSSIYLSSPNIKSTLTSTQANTINTGINEMITFFDTRRTHDENFYTNMKTMVSDYQKTREFSNMGESETDLVNNYTGSSKILTRINS
jgi:hypothetical protein